MENKIYLTDLSCYGRATKEQKARVKKEQYYDLMKLPTQGMRNEFSNYLEKRAMQISVLTIGKELYLYGPLCRFLKKKKFQEESFLNRSEEDWLRELKGWMMQEGLQIVKQKTSVYGKPGYEQGEVLRFFKRMLKLLQPEDMREEKEKDVWVLNKLGIPLIENPVKNIQTYNFSDIQITKIREETKKAVYHMLQSQSVNTVRRNISDMKFFTDFLIKKYPEVLSCSAVNRQIIESYLIYIKVEERKNKNVASNIRSLRNTLEIIGKIYEQPQLENLFLSTDIPSRSAVVYKTYSDAEVKRLNASIANLDEQMIRMMVIHQLLGTRMSDTLTLERDCLFQIAEQDMVSINQPKTHNYIKPISKEVAKLIQKAIDYSKQRYEETKYIFVNEEQPQKPYQYTTVQNKIVKMIHDNNLRDDDGELFGFGSHLFRHYYGVKLTELHLDDITIAKMLGHRGVTSVKHYRKMSNQQMADETRRAREKMSEIILKNIEGWGGAYEQIRQDD